MRPIVLLAAFTLLVNACASRGSPSADGHAPGGCKLPSFAALVLDETDPVLTPGGSLQLGRPIAVYGPMGPRALPERCRVRWSVEGAAATIDVAGRLTALASARPGDSVVVVARAMGAEARRQVPVIGTGPMPLAGKWRQEPTTECVGSRGPVRELEFRRSGEVLLTFQPFESYVDWTGVYSFDSATGALTLRNRGASDAPARLQAVAGLSGGSLTLTVTPQGDAMGLFINAPGIQSCRAVFHAF